MATTNRQTTPASRPSGFPKAADFHLAVSHGDGLTVVTARVAGTFPNSPLDLQHVFAVEGGKIASLQIG